MANRYWVGGTGTWDNTAGSKWSATSGGTGGASAPGFSDDVFFNSASGSGVVTISGTRNLSSLTCTGFTGTLERSSPASTSADVISVQGTGGVTLASGMTTSSLLIQGTGSTWALNPAGKTMFSVQPAGSTINLAGALTLTQELFANGGTFNTNNHAVTALRMRFTNSSVANLGSSLITITGTGDSFTPCVGFASGVTLNAGTSTVKLTNNSSTGKQITLNGKTLYNLWIATAGSGFVLLDSSGSYNDLKADPATIIRFAPGTVHAVQSFTAVGSSGNLITLLSTSGQWTLSKASGSVVCDYLDLKGSIATGGATFDPGLNSIDSGNNVGWWTAPPSTGHDRMFLLF